MHEHNDVDPADGTRGWDRKNGVSPTLIGLGVIAILAIIFIVGNGDKVHVRLIIPKVEMPVWVAIVVAMAIGVVLDRLFIAWWRRRRNN